MNRYAGYVFSLALLVLSSSAHSAQFLYEAYMDGPSDGTPSPGTGYATVLYDDVAHTLGLNATFTGLTGNTTNSHIHAPTAAAFSGTSGVATPTPTFPGFPSGVTSGAYSNTLDLTLASSWNAAFITAQGGTPASAEANFASYLAQGKAYWNIHSSQYSGGEIRGFLRAVPEPVSIGLIACGLAGMGCISSRRR